MSSRYLELELKLLLLKYGREAVEKCLSGIGVTNVEDVLLELADKKSSRSPRVTSYRGMEPRLVNLFSDRPKDLDVVRDLMVRYESGDILPRLRDVQRFLDRYSTNPKRELKSRRVALNKVIAVFATVDSAELKLIFNYLTQTGSDYEILANAIMKT